MKKFSLKILYLTFPLILSPLSLAEEYADSLKIGFGSCVDETKPQPIWRPWKKKTSMIFSLWGTMSMEIWIQVNSPI